MSDKKINRIPADQLTAYERWELPTMEPGGNDVIRSHVSSAEMPVKPLTASDLETIRLEAYEAGLAEGKEEGLKKGYQEGHEKGHQEGVAAGTQQGIQEGLIKGEQQKKEEIDEVNSRLKHITEQLLDPIKQHDDEIEEAILNLVLTISRAVIMRELILDSQQIRRTVADAVNALPSTPGNVKITVNSVDYDRIISIASSIADDVQVLSSDDILPGGCKVETLHSQVDATVEKRFQKTVQEMLDRHASSVPVDEAPDLTESMEDMTDFHRDVLESDDFNPPSHSTDLSDDTDETS